MLPADYIPPENNNGTLIFQAIRNAMAPFDPQMVNLEMRDGLTEQTLLIDVKTLPNHIFSIPLTSARAAAYDTGYLVAFLMPEIHKAFRTRLVEPEPHIILGED